MSNLVTAAARVSGHPLFVVKADKLGERAEHLRLLYSWVRSPIWEASGDVSIVSKLLGQESALGFERQSFTLHVSEDLP